jgi:putative glutamine amidotransferase
MELPTLIQNERSTLVSRISAMLGGDRHAAEDIAQETLTRAWELLPAGLAPPQQRAWLSRTARNLAVDELRRRRRRPIAEIDDLDVMQALAAGAPETDTARAALEQLSAHERFVLLLRFEGGFSHAEIGQLLDTSEEAARKRVFRARSALIEAYRRGRSDPQPLILLLAHEDAPTEPYIGWLQRAGARVKTVFGAPSERQLALADGLSTTGHVSDIDSRLYGQQPRSLQGRTDLDVDRRELAAVRQALALDLPILGICRGHQMLNIASGGDLYQDVVQEGVTGSDHAHEHHAVRTGSDGAARRVLGRATRVRSQHHQAVRKLGRNLTVTATSPDGVVETIERNDRSFAMGLQWHAELTTSGAGQLVAEALVEAAAGRAA